MPIRAEVIEDSYSLESGQRLTTLEVEMPRFLLAEMNTHRVFSRNSASSRAIPTVKQLERLIDDPVVPWHWGLDQPGMQGFVEVDDSTDLETLTENWLIARDFAVLGAVSLMGGTEQLYKTSTGNDVGEEARAEVGLLEQKIAEIADRLGNPFRESGPRIHKQIPNRMLEPYAWHTIVVTASEWNNFYALRTDEAAEPHIQDAANLMLGAHNASDPIGRTPEEYHLPYVTEEDREEYPIDLLKKMAVARTARVSYENQRSQKAIDGEVAMYERLTSNGHASPLEHPARPMTKVERGKNVFNGNFRGWVQVRSELPNSDNFQRFNGQDPYVLENLLAA